MCADILAGRCGGGGGGVCLCLFFAFKMWDWIEEEDSIGHMV